MSNLKFFVVTAMALISLVQVYAKPINELTRLKRTSDQRLAELETLFALSRMNGKLVSVPIGFGKIDPNKLGRRKRSDRFLIQHLMDFLNEEKFAEESNLSQHKAIPKNNFFFNDSFRRLNHPPVKLPE